MNDFYQQEMQTSLYCRSLSTIFQISENDISKLASVGEKKRNQEKWKVALDMLQTRNDIVIGLLAVGSSQPPYDSIIERILEQ